MKIIFRFVLLRRPFARSLNKLRSGSTRWKETKPKRDLNCMHSGRGGNCVLSDNGLFTHFRKFRMKGLTASVDVGTSALLSSAILTCEVDGEPVDMVKALASLSPCNRRTKLMVKGFKLLEQVPDLVIGNPDVEHVELSTEKLEALEADVLKNSSLCHEILSAVARSLHAIGQVAQIHPETCGVSKELGNSIRRWVHYHGRWDEHITFPPTKATRIEDLKFFLGLLIRHPGKQVMHVAVPMMQQCNPEAVLPSAWQIARDRIDEQAFRSGTNMSVASATTIDDYKQRMGDLAVRFRGDRSIPLKKETSGASGSGEEEWPISVPAWSGQSGVNTKNDHHPPE
ncbi:hypothetical protein GNI_172140 [Gregarina niphandrodes]|uniref:Uncharacterized protein n=1 Tax=Gregarina niphandrodes TaxID=110365 RepID=A0A023AYT8_GRENI|nr:hypothetical protein GNI_172140 [Gregarina niphandrodes]EZG43435.1 hypothetical protein GNI_172140 [Gregarina niphandrodes]|eukprot:XP_011133333.1 hypothetical protein GNI_172140 [Gregarina niphandrodes]